VRVANEKHVSAMTGFGPNHNKTAAEYELEPFW
jgi:hypothetical protein